MINQREHKMIDAATRVIATCNEISKSFDVIIKNCNIRAHEAISSPKCYCYNSDEYDIKPQSAEAIKNKIFADTKSGIEILTGNIEAGYFGKYDISDLKQFKKVLELLKSTVIDIHKLDMIDLYNDQSCRYKAGDGTNKSRYTVVYNNIELFTITNIDSETRFPEEKTSGLSFDLEFHIGFDEVYHAVNIEKTSEIASTKDMLETDIKFGKKMYEDKEHDDTSYDCQRILYREKIINFEKILKLLSCDTIDLNKLQTIDLFGDYSTNKSGYTVTYNGLKLLTINHIDKGIFFLHNKYERIKDFEVDFHDSFDELYYLQKPGHDERIKEKNYIVDDLKEGIEVIKNEMKDDIENKCSYENKISDIKKILRLLNSNVISVSKLKIVNSFNSRDDVPDFDYENEEEDKVDTFGYTVLYNGVALFSATEKISFEFNSYGVEFHGSAFDEVYEFLNSADTHKVSEQYA